MEQFRPILEPSRIPTDPPLISCLMVSRGCLFPARFAIGCYQRQTWPHRELLIVCGVPGNQLADYVAALGDPTIRFVSTDPASLGELRNVSVDAARGSLLCQWDDDDLYHAQRLEFQHEQLAASAAAAHFLRRLVVWWPAQRRLAISKRRVWEGSMLVRREALGRYLPIGRREDTRAVGDLRQHRDRIALTDEPLAYCYIIHGSNTSGPGHVARLFATASETVAAEEYEDRLKELAGVWPMHAYQDALHSSEQSEVSRTRR